MSCPKIDEQEADHETASTAERIRALQSELVLLKASTLGKETSAIRLAESGAELLKAQEIARIGSWTMDLDSGFVTWTSELFKMFGMRPRGEAPSFEQQQALFVGDSWERLNKEVAHTIRTGQPYEIELKLRKEDGSIGWLWASGALERDDQGRPVKLRGVAQDITESKGLRDALQSERQFSSRICDLSPAGICVVRLSDLIYLYMNEQYRRIFGFEGKDLSSFTAMDFRSRVHEDDCANYQEHLNRLAQGYDRSEIEYRYRYMDGRIIWCHVSASPFEVDDDGRVASIIAYKMDVTRQKKIEEELIQAANRAELANTYKDQFLANMSHEIRTPLNGIVGSSGLLRDDALNRNDRNHYLDIINDCSGRLLDMINDILDMSKIEAGEMSLSVHDCKPYEIIMTCHETLSVVTGNKRGISPKLIVEVAEADRQASILCDPNRLQQVLSNLLDNAVKYGQGSDIVYGYILMDHEIEFFVRDGGIGISDKGVIRIFERFTRLEEVIGNHEGSGLGLSLCKAIIELLGGEIWVNSKLGEGSEFRFRIPCTPTYGT